MAVISIRGQSQDKVVAFIGQRVCLHESASSSFAGMERCVCNVIARRRNGERNVRIIMDGLDIEITGRIRLGTLREWECVRKYQL